MYRIIVYHPDSILLEKIKRLPEDKFRIVGTVDDDTEEITHVGAKPLTVQLALIQCLEYRGDGGIVHASRSDPAETRLSRCSARAAVSAAPVGTLKITE